jgi:hypothetical protein
MNDLQQNVKSGRQNIKTCCWVLNASKLQKTHSWLFVHGFQHAGCYPCNKLKRFKNCDMQTLSAKELFGL